MRPLLIISQYEKGERLDIYLHSFGFRAFYGSQIQAIIDQMMFHCGAEDPKGKASLMRFSCDGDLSKCLITSTPPLANIFLGKLKFTQKTFLP